MANIRALDIGSSDQPGRTRQTKTVSGEHKGNVGFGGSKVLDIRVAWFDLARAACVKWRISALTGTMRYASINIASHRGAVEV